jgi:hypothetical protein
MVEGYFFSFTKERKAREIVCLLLIMTLVWLLPDFIPTRPAAVSATQWKHSSKPGPKCFPGQRHPSKACEEIRGIDSTVERSKKTKPFYFDPKTISMEEW